MKKAYFLLVTLTLLFTACSTESEKESKLLVKEINTTESNGSAHSMKYFYDGGKISYFLTDATLRTEFMYAQNTDLILVVRQWNGSTLNSLTSFSYDVNGLIFDQRNSDFVNHKEEYITYDYNDDNTVTRKIYDGIDPWPFLLKSTSRINLDAKGRFTKIADWDGTHWIPKSETVYADYNSAFQNIVAFEYILSYINAKNNFSKVITYNSAGSVDTTTDFQTELNLSKYPRVQTETLKALNGAVISTTQTTFSYY